MYVDAKTNCNAMSRLLQTYVILSKGAYTDFTATCLEVTVSFLLFHW